MGVRVFFLIVFPYWFSGRRLYAADPPEALEERTSMLITVGQSSVYGMSRSLLVFRQKGSGREGVNYAGVELRLHSTTRVPLAIGLERVKISRIGKLAMVLSTVAASNEQFTRNLASWVGDVLVTVRTAVSVESYPAHPLPFWQRSYLTWVITAPDVAEKVLSVIPIFMCITAKRLRWVR
ncbi:uncharacterized protein LY79DRAFT_100297 [Colletotrichum navitas]|uniref:Uncharacterized protein n=1 Tax=Colletotrichum navitas TaxID=681940 RepID=A0AAD8Q5D2_9PEZI|nr:uncharacterized protein LY79DRAFT_100297 [Colletotrichum navitas]KAK1595497.1 hypothetical protein LY79DRAFT_100297 [Colletotrichum navitas]